MDLTDAGNTGFEHCMIILSDDTISVNTARSHSQTRLSYLYGLVRTISVPTIWSLLVHFVYDI